jgi:hypothetical protein
MEEHELVDFLLSLFVQPGIFDDDTCLARKGRKHLDVFFREDELLRRGVTLQDTNDFPFDL